MKKKKYQYTTFDNVVVFPGTVDRLVSKANEFIKKEDYHEAIQFLEEALQYTEGDEHLLSIYAYSLYEVKDYTKAKEICERLLKLGPSMYIEIMELYLTVSMQLKEYKQVEKIITSLLEEGIIPDEQKEKFRRLRDLNAEISEKLEMEEVEFTPHQIDFDLFESENFLSLPLKEQVNKLHELTLANIRPIIPQLKLIVEHEEIHSFVKSLILILLNEQEADIELKIHKFDCTMVVNPSKMELPTDLPQYKMVSNLVFEKLQHDPSVLEMVEYLIAKHSIVTYPFEWLHYHPEDIAQCYIDYVGQMLGQEKKVNEELFTFLQQLELLSELEEI